MRIKNFRELATTPLRKAALQLLDAGLAACDIEKVLEKTITVENYTLQVGEQSINLRMFEKILVVGAGKAAWTMANHLEHVLGKRITDGIVIDVQKKHLKHIRCVKGTHPLPSATNQNAARAIRKLLEKPGAGTLVICVWSGGGSVLLADPFASQASAQKTVEALLRSGATIHEVNTVRKHLYGLAGGNLAALCYPGRVLSIIISDVVGDDPSTIASGPTVYDDTTVADAERILKKYQIHAAGLRETSKEHHLFNRVNNVLVLTNQTVLDAMVAKAHELKLEPHVLGNTEQGEARIVEHRLVQQAPAEPGHVLFAAGETTVTVTGKGTGGRNQELALAAIPELALQKDICLASMGTDGQDHSNVAGAIVDNASLSAAQKKKLDVAKALADNDSYTFFKKLGKHAIKTGPTGTNVADVMVVVRGPLKK